MIKKLSIIFIGFITMISCLSKLNAAEASITVSTNKSSVIVGNTFNATVTIYSSGGIGSWEYNIKYDSSKLKLISGQSSVADVAQSSGKTSVSYNYTFKAIASGSAEIGVKSYNVINWDVEDLSTSASSKTIKIITQQELEASYSKNNNLSGISVEGHELDKTFDKDTLDYIVKVPSDTEKIKLSAITEDKTASISGIGEFEVSEGDNKFEIIVLAQNGAKKTYTVTVKVQDENPINVLVDGKKYTVVKRSSTLKMPATYEETKILIDEIEIPAFKSSITKFVLVGLKDETGINELFIYDENKNTYIKYTEIKTTGLTIVPKKPTKIPNGYKKTTIKINEKDILAYNYNKNKEFYLIYGTNIETGKEEFYEYDIKNNTISRYNNVIIDELTKRNENYMFIILILGLETILLLLILLVTFIKNKKRRKRIMQKKLNENKEEKNISISIEEDKKDKDKKSKKKEKKNEKDKEA